MAKRYRCTDCGNKTRFDVTATRRTREFHHFSIAGELVIEESELLHEEVEPVVCRWCSSTDVETLEVDEPVPESVKEVQE